MKTLKPLVILLAGLASLSGCSALQHGGEPNYTLCKTIEGKLNFKDNSTLLSTNPTSTYSQTASGNATQEEKVRLQATYEKLACYRYESMKF